MAVHWCIAILCLLAATASAQLLITCYQRDMCSSSGLEFDGVTIQACCDNVNGGGLGGIGLGASYQQDGVEGCTPCPVESTIGFINEPYNGTERDGFITLTVELVGALERELLVNLTTRDFPMPEAIAGEDYIGISTVLTFAPTMDPTSVIPVNVSVLDDDVTEGDERFEALLDILTTGTPISFFPIDSDRAPATILEDDRVVIGMEETSVFVDEDVGERELCASIMSGTLGKEVMVMVVYESRNAIAVEDYIANPVILTFNADMTCVCFNTTIVNDERYELREDFFVNISTSEPDIDIMPSNTIVMIDDEDMVLLGWEFPVYNTTEDDDTLEICALLRGNVTLADNLALINLLTEDGTAISGEDYVRALSPNTLEFLPGGVTQMCTTADIIDDDVVEDSPEYFEAVISLISIEGVTVDPERTEIQIFDNDLLAIVGFERNLYIVPENDSLTMEICAVLLPPPALAEGVNLTVMITFADGTAVAPEDYNEMMASLVFDSTTSRSCVDFTALEDDVGEGAEILTAMLTSDDGVILAPDGATIEIVDDGGVTCPEDETGGEYITGESFTLLWPTSGLGEATLHCPCGDTFSSILMASRNCSWDSLNNQAVWDDADNSVCETLSINLCFITMVDTSEQVMDILASGVVTPGNVVQVSEVISILGITSEVTQGVVRNDFLDAVDEFLNFDRELIRDGEILGYASTRVLESIELFSALVSLESTAGKIMFSRENFAVLIIELETVPNRSFQGQLIEAGSGLDINGNIDFTQGMFSDSNSGTIMMPLASVFITNELFEIFQNNTQPDQTPRLIIVAYDVSSPLFQDPNRNDTGSIILSVLQSPLQSTVPPTDLEEPVMFQYQINQVINTARGDVIECVFWNFTMNDGLGGWSSEGCSPDLNRSTSTTVVCRCNHLTSFAVLLDVKPSHNDGQVEDFQVALSYIGGIISTFFLTITVITYISSVELRSKKHGKILIQMCFSLIGLYLSFLLTSLLGRFFYEDVSSNARKQVCITFSALVHYFLLVYFCITVAQSVLLYVQLVMVLGTKNILHHFQLRAGLVCWILPLVLVCIFLGPTHDYYLTEDMRGMETRATCFPNMWPLYVGVITPFAIIYALNVVVFLIIVSVVLRRKERNPNISNTKKNMRKAFIVFILALMFGIGWAFGILGSEGSNSLSIVFQFLFIITVGCQGLLIFLLYPCRSKDARDLWKKWFNSAICYLHDEQSKSSTQKSRCQLTPEVESSIKVESILNKKLPLPEKPGSTISPEFQNVLQETDFDQPQNAM